MDYVENLLLEGSGIPFLPFASKNINGFVEHNIVRGVVEEEYCITPICIQRKCDT